MADTIDIAFGFDTEYASHAAAVVASVVSKAPGAKLRFVMVNTGMADDRRKQVEAAAPNATFLWPVIRDEDLPVFGDRENLAHVKSATFLRLMLETVAPADSKRIIYLDADIIVLRDIRELWEANLGGKPVGGVPDVFCDENVFADRWSLPRVPNGYFNAGILLIDLEQVRAKKLFSKAMQFVIEKNPHFADQDALNWVVWNNWQKINSCWNVQRDMVIPGLSAQLAPAKRYEGGRPGIVHFTGKDKPWRNDGWHPWAWIYWEALGQTSFVGEVSRRYGVNSVKRLRMWMRWLRRKPKVVEVATA